MTDAWGAAQSAARWYGCAVYENEDGETEYHEAYSTAEEEPDPRQLAPESAKILETVVKSRLNDSEYDQVIVEAPLSPGLTDIG